MSQINVPAYKISLVQRRGRKGGCARQHEQPRHGKDAPRRQRAKTTGSLRACSLVSSIAALVRTEDQIESTHLS